MIRKAGNAGYDELTCVWERAVLSTHDFPGQKDYEFYKSNLCMYFGYVDLYVVKRHGRIAGFTGIAAGSIEMLFVMTTSDEAVQAKSLSCMP